MKSKSIVIVVCFAISPASAETVYDLRFGDGFVGGVETLSPDSMVAQPFFLGDNDTVTSVTLDMFRVGQPNGIIHVDIFDDSGSGTPGVSLGRLGSIDATSIGTPPLGSLPMFKNPVSGLIPNEQYYVVYSQENGTDWTSQKSIYWAATKEDDGANGAGEGLAITPPCGATEWHTIRGFLCQGSSFPVWFYATIEAAVSGSQSCDVSDDSLCDIRDIDQLMNEVASSTHAIGFDLNGDSRVDNGDRDEWLLLAAQKNGLSESYLVGDSNLDGSVNSADLNALAISWQQERHEWSRGNFANSGVDSADLNALALNWQLSIPSALPANATVPEPAATHLSLVVLALMWRRMIGCRPR